MTPDNRDPLLDAFLAHGYQAAPVWLGWQEWSLAFTQTMVDRGFDRETTLQHLRRVEASCGREQRSAEALFGNAGRYAFSLPRTPGTTRRRWTLSALRALAIGSFLVCNFAGVGGGPPTSNDLTWQLGALLGVILVMTTEPIAVWVRSRSSGWATAGLIALVVPAGFLMLTLHQPLFQTPRALSLVGAAVLSLSAAVAASWIQWNRWPQDPAIIRHSWWDKGITTPLTLSVFAWVQVFLYFGLVG